jgi:hypothetical protein
MKDSHDTQTADLLPAHRPRGRPRTGTALTNAERQAKHRAKRALQPDNPVTVTINNDLVTVTINRGQLVILQTLLQFADEFDAVGMSADDRRSLRGLETAIYAAMGIGSHDALKGAAAPASRTVEPTRPPSGGRRNKRK